MIAVATDLSRPTVKYDDLELAYSFASDTCDIESTAWICRKTGKIYWESSDLDDEFEVPHDVGDCSLYASVPDQQELGLGTRLVFRFVKSKIPAHYDRVSSIFRRRGAYGRYKDFLQDQGLLEEWYEFENSTTENALRIWAEGEGFVVLPAVVNDDPKRIYQFKIELQDLEPAIWRRIQVPETYNFWDLHVAIQDAMGWLDYHLHAFRVPEKDSATVRIIGIPDEDFQEATPTFAGWETAVVDYFFEVGGTAEYECDFGDGWLHNVILEGILPGDPDTQYPKCMDGERACPPEDCGGVLGYYEILDAMAAPEVDEHKELLDWLGKKYDPDKFMPQEVEFDDPKSRWKSAFSNK